MNDFDMDEFLKERNEALFSLDKDKIVAYCKKYDVPIPEDETVFWAGIHKAILGLTDAPLEIKFGSVKWLREHGFRPGIF